MPTWINPDILRETGFRDLKAGEQIEAKFYRIHVFKISGYSFSDDSLTIETESEIKDSKYQLGIGNSVNTICRSLLGDDFVKDEKDWRKKKNATPPFLVLHFGPTSSYTCSEGLVKQTGSEITTYQCFQSAGSELKKLEQIILPSVITALTTQLSSEKHSVRFIPIQGVRYGITTTGETINDFTFTSSNVTISTSYLVEELKLREQLSEASKTANNIYQKAAYFFYLGLNEEDNLKKFLYYFLSIEVFTHKTFNSIDQCKEIAKAIIPTEHVAESVKALFRKQQNELRSIADRFVWCAACVWKTINDSDIAEFKRLKGIRDAIAHGRIDEPKFEASQSVEKLVIKLLKEI